MVIKKNQKEIIILNNILIEIILVNYLWNIDNKKGGSRN